jgi:hypothetical protein
MAGNASARYFTEFMKKWYPMFSRRATQLCILSSAMEKIALGAPDARAIAILALEQSDPFGWKQRRDPLMVVAGLLPDSAGTRGVQENGNG